MADPVTPFHPTCADSGHLGRTVAPLAQYTVSGPMGTRFGVCEVCAPYWQRRAGVMPDVYRVESIGVEVTS